MGKYHIGSTLRNSDIMKYATEEQIEVIRPILRKKSTRTISGVTVVAVMTKPLECPGNCLFCPGEQSQPGEKAAQSYTGREPAARRSIMYHYDPYEQTKHRLLDQKAIGHKIDKVELICMGGTLLAGPEDYQRFFIKGCFDAINNFYAPGFNGDTRTSDYYELKKYLETARLRLVGVTVETRPDFCRPEHVDKMLDYGCTRVEIGVQTTRDEILSELKRGHTVADSIMAIKSAKDAGLKVNVHMMPNLPGSNLDADLEEFKTLEASVALYNDSSTRRLFTEIIEKAGEVYGFETIAKKKDGTAFYIRESARLVKDENGKILYYEGIIEDITSQKQAEEKIIEAKESAEQSDKLKTEFLAQMSHEIRTPINVILSFSNLIKDEVRGLISKELQNSFSIIDNASRRMIRTIDLILNMSQLQTGSYQSRMGSVDVHKDVLIPLYPEFSRLANEKNLRLIINKRIEDSNIYGDEYSLRQIFDNLIHNAIKYTPKGSIELNIEKGGNSHLKVEVLDTGIGISEQYLPNLFKPFTQEEHGYTRKYEGNGLGLALVKRYCELNKAEIKVESIKNKGTKFTLLFPPSN